MNLGDRKIDKGGWSFDDEDINNKVRTFEQEQNNYLYDVEPQSQNLFLVANFSESVSETGANALLNALIIASSLLSVFSFSSLYVCNNTIA